MTSRCAFQIAKKFLTSNGNYKQYYRTYLSSTYQCEDAWNGRFKDPLVKNIKPDLFYYELFQKINKEGKLSAIDADLFINCIMTNEVAKHISDIEKVIELVRKSPETINTLQSTTHAATRLLLESENLNQILYLLADPIRFGIFLDHYMANLIMDQCLTDNNYTAAAMIASHMMLQENFEHPLTKALSVVSCLKYIFSDQNAPWVDYNPVIDRDEKIAVAFIRNPYFDDHFDLKDSNHIVGKTLAWVSLSLGEEERLIKANCAVLGWSLYEKWRNLEDTLKTLVGTKPLLHDVYSLTLNTLEKCEDQEQKIRIEGLLEEIKKSGGVDTSSIQTMATEHLEFIVKGGEDQYIEEQKKVYSSWLKLREEAFNQQLEDYERKKLLAEILSKKKELKEKEDVIFFFDNQDKWELAAHQQETNRLERQKKSTKKQVEEEYIVPEIRKR